MVDLLHLMLEKKLTVVMFLLEYRIKILEVMMDKLMFHYLTHTLV